MIYMFDMDGTLLDSMQVWVHVADPGAQTDGRRFCQMFFAVAAKEQGFYRNRLGYCQSFGTASVGCRQCFFGNILRHGQ